MSDLVGRTPAGAMEMLTLGTTAQGLAVPVGATFALISIEGGGVRWTDTGQPPTTTFGHQMADGAHMLYGGAIGEIEFVAVAGSATVMVSYYR